MVKNLKEDALHLLITEATIKSVTIKANGGVEASVALMVGKNVLTYVTLYSSEYYQKDPNYLDLNGKLDYLKDQVFMLIRKHALISLERIQPTLGAAETESEVIDP